MTTNTSTDKAIIRLVNSLLDEGDDDTKVVIDMNIFTADTTPTDLELRAFHQRHCDTLDYDSVKMLLLNLLLQKRSVRGTVAIVCAAIVHLTDSFVFYRDSKRWQPRK
jgi:hypothetical protein